MHRKHTISSKITSAANIYFSKSVKDYSDIFGLCPPPPVRYSPPITEHVSLHSKSNLKTWNNNKLGGGYTRKDPIIQIEELDFISEIFVYLYLEDIEWHI